MILKKTDTITPPNAVLLYNFLTVSNNVAEQNYSSAALPATSQTSLDTSIITEAVTDQPVTSDIQMRSNFLPIMRNETSTSAMNNQTSVTEENDIDLPIKINSTTPQPLSSSESISTSTTTSALTTSTTELKIRTLF